MSGCRCARARGSAPGAGARVLRVSGCRCPGAPGARVQVRPGPGERSGCRCPGAGARGSAPGAGARVQVHPGERSGCRCTRGSAGAGARAQKRRKGASSKQIAHQRRARWRCATYVHRIGNSSYLSAPPSKTLFRRYLSVFSAHSRVSAALEVALERSNPQECASTDRPPTRAIWHTRSPHTVSRWRPAPPAPWLSEHVGTREHVFLPRKPFTRAAPAPVPLPPVLLYFLFSYILMFHLFLSMIPGTYRVFLLVYGPVLPCSPTLLGRNLAFFLKFSRARPDAWGACRRSTSQEYQR